MKQRSVLLALCCTVLLWVVACADMGGGAANGTNALPPTPLVWPKPPEAERIRLVQVVSTPRDWGITRSFWRRLADALSGRAEDALQRPSAVAERAGVLYVADPGAAALWIFDAPRDRAIRVTQVGEQGLASPVSLALGPQDGVFVADTALKKVFLLDRDGQLVRTFETQGLERPAAVVWDDHTHRLFVLDSLRHRVTVFDGNGALLRHMGESGNQGGQFNRPTHMALDTSDHLGNLLITDALNFRVQAINPQGGLLWKFGQNGNGSGDFAAPKGLATDQEGHLYVVDALFEVVQIFNRQGQLLLAFGGRGNGVGQFMLPRGVFVSAQDKVYVADTYNQRIQVFLGALASREAVKEGVK